MRPIDIQTLAALQSTNVRMALLAELHFVSEIAYCWTGYGNLVVAGQTYLGLGKLASVSVIGEESTVSSQGITLGLEGVSPDMIAEGIGDVQQGLPCILSMAFFDANNALIGTPQLCFCGVMDQPTIDEGTDTCTITISAENRMALLNQSRERRYTDQEQRRDYPNDCSFQYVTAIQNWAGTWGRN